MKRPTTPPVMQEGGQPDFKTDILLLIAVIAISAAMVITYSYFNVH